VRRFFKKQALIFEKYKKTTKNTSPVFVYSITEQGRGFLLSSFEKGKTPSADGVFLVNSIRF